MATWTALTFAALEVLAAAKMNQMQANFTALVQAAAGIPAWTPSSAIFTPGSAIIGITVDQDYDEVAFKIDSESASYHGLEITAKRGLKIIQDISNGRGMLIQCTVDEAGAEALVNIENVIANDNRTKELFKISQLATSSSADCWLLDNDGTGNDIAAPNFTLKNGYIAPGGNEAMQWDVIHITLDGTSPDVVAMSVVEGKVRGLMCVGYETGTDEAKAIYETDFPAFMYTYISDGDVYFDYGAGWNNDDEGNVVVLSVA